MRKAVMHDAASISKTFKLSFRHAYTGILPYQDLNKIIEQRSPLWWQSYIDTYSNIWTIEENGIVAGYISFGPSRYEALPYEVEIYAFFVRPEYQGNGYGKKLLQKALKEIKKSGMDGISLWIFEKNVTTIDQLLQMGGYISDETLTLHKSTALKKIAICWE